MNAGLNRCLGEFVMRMDSDDICTSDRVERQIAYAETHPEIDVIAAWSEEFFEDGGRPQLKVTPAGHDGIVRALRWRNVIHHPTLLVRKKSLLAVSGYRSTFGFLEDYDLFVRLVLSGARFHAIPKVLVHVLFQHSPTRSPRRAQIPDQRRQVPDRMLANRVSVGPTIPCDHPHVQRIPPLVRCGSPTSLRPRTHLIQSANPSAISAGISRFR